MSSVTLRWLSKKCRLLSKKRALHVRFAPKATEVLRCREASLCARTGLLRRSKEHPYSIASSASELRGTYVRFRQPRTFGRKRLSAWLLSEVREVGVASVSLGGMP